MHVSVNLLSKTPANKEYSFGGKNILDKILSA